ncbi:MAG TPA: rod shape-determining protein RodA [Solirubrobacterales bacterium]|jgi:rod shape determining protein RodA|nr:rod shape-determining protein RodA [Solirubrobacterales bacterium]
MEAGPVTIPARRATLAEQLSLRYIDPWLLAASLGLIAFSVLALTSAGRNEVAGQPDDFASRQAAYAVVGIALMVAVWRLDYTRLRDLRVSLYTTAIGLVLLALLFGATVRGADRWIELPFFSFQPSELAKLLLCLSVAGFAFELVRKRSRLGDTAVLLGLGLVPAGLVLLQPDLGTALVLIVGTLAVLFVAGVPWQHFAAIAAAAAVIGGAILTLGPAVGIDGIHDYQEDRLTAFLNPSEDPSGTSYQVRQSMIAVGSGESTGRGDESTQTELLFLPERHTDFIFAAIGERFGFAGAAMMTTLFALLLWRALRVMRLAHSFYGTLTAAGILAMLAFQLLVNVGMNVGIMPVTGIPLPLISYGGSSVLGSFLALGILQGIHVQAERRARRPSAYTPLPALPTSAGPSRSPR